MFDRKTPDEVRLLVFDFSNKVPTGITLGTAPTVAATLLSGTGTSTDLVLGTASTIDLTVQTLGTGGLDGCRYRVKALVSGSNGELYEQDRDLQVDSSAAVVA